MITLTYADAYKIINSSPAEVTKYLCEYMSELEPASLQLLLEHLIREAKQIQIKPMQLEKTVVTLAYSLRDAALVDLVEQAFGISKGEGYYYTLPLYKSGQYTTTVQAIAHLLRRQKWMTPYEPYANLPEVEADCPLSRTEMIRYAAQLTYAKGDHRPQSTVGSHTWRDPMGVSTLFSSRDNRQSMSLNYCLHKCVDTVSSIILEKAPTSELGLDLMLWARTDITLSYAPPVIDLIAKAIRSLPQPTIAYTYQYIAWILAHSTYYTADSVNHIVSTLPTVPDTSAPLTPYEFTYLLSYLEDTAKECGPLHSFVICVK